MPKAGSKTRAGNRGRFGIATASRDTSALGRVSSDRRMKAGTIILHSDRDEVVPLEHSRQLVQNSDLPPELVIVGENHRMIDTAALEALMRAVERAAKVGPC